LFLKELSKLRLIVNEGKIIAANFVEVPRQRNRKEENELIKEDRGDELWKEHPHKKCHKDTDARWVTKNKQKYFG
jgi:hypothetical protein